MTKKERREYDDARLLDLIEDMRDYRAAYKEAGMTRDEAYNSARRLRTAGRWPLAPEDQGALEMPAAPTVRVQGHVRSVYHPDFPGFPVAATDSAPQSPPRWSVPESKMKRYDDFERLEGDILFLSDLHCPFHSREVVEAALNTADRQGIRHLVLGGDQTDSGAFNAKRGHMRTGYRWQDMAEEYEAILKICLECFEKVTVLDGNHDNYLTSHLKGEVDSAWLLSRLFRNEDDRIKFSSYEHADLVSGGRKWKLLHGANYSVNALTTAKQYASKFLSNILMGHQHQSEEGFDRSGTLQVICNGGAFDPTRFGYTNLGPRTNPVQTQGFSTVINGIGRLYKFANNKAV